MIDELDYLYLESKFDEDYKQIIKFIIDNNELKKENYIIVMSKEVSIHIP